MKKLQQVQAQADERWGFDFDAFDDLVAQQQSLPAPGFAKIEPEVDKLHRQLEYVVLALAGEVGELANLVKKARRELLLLGDSTVSKEEMREELADILAYALKLSNLMGWNLEQAYLEKMKKNEARFGNLARRGR
jgi:NTP pyrophosphatase (non-canonical NTP hydrolase)